jgi:hypothetical protein
LVEHCYNCRFYVCQEETHRVRNASGKLAKRTRWVERCEVRGMVELKVPVVGKGLVSRAVFGRLERPVLFGSERSYFDADGELVECNLYQRNEGGRNREAI